MIEHQCPVCNKIFKTDNKSTQKFCSHKCYQVIWSQKVSEMLIKSWEKRKKVLVQKECITCKKKFNTVDLSRKYCSRDCYIISLKKNIKNYKVNKKLISETMKKVWKERGVVHIIKICLNCKKEFDTTNNNRKFCSRKCSDEGLSDIAKKNGFGLWMKGRKLTEETKSKISLLHKGHETSLETRKKISEANFRDNNGMFKKHHSLESRRKISQASKLRWKDPEYSEKILKFMRSDIGRESARRAALKAAEKIKKGNTKCEIEMKHILDELHVDYIHLYPIYDIKHGYMADFFIPKYNLVIEVDGKYWHGYPKKYKPDQIINGKKASEIWAKDALRNSELQFAGYKILRFWEGEFTKEIVFESLKVFENSLRNSKIA